MKRRRLIKTISYRAGGMLISTLVVLAFTRRVRLSLGIGAVDMVLSSIYYWVHEKVWDGKS